MRWRRAATSQRTIWRLVLAITLSLLLPGVGGGVFASGARFADSWSSPALRTPIVPFPNGAAATLVLGQPNFLSRLTGVNAQTIGYLDYGVGFDAEGNLWVADWNDNRVLEFSPPFANGEPASIVIGQSDFSSTQPQIGATGLSNPFGVAFDTRGDLWVPDYSNNRILEYIPPFHNDMAAALVLGQPGFSSESPAASPAGLAGPCGITFDASGDLWVADYLNNRVVEFLPPFVDGESASVVFGQKDFMSGAAGAGARGLHWPQTVAFDPLQNLWVSDFGNNRVVEFSPPFRSDPSAAGVVGQAGFETNRSGSGPSGLSGPFAAAFDGWGKLWVADTGNNRVLSFPPPIRTGASAAGVIGQGSFSTNQSGTGASGLAMPADVAFDPLGDLWVLDQGNGRVLEFLPSSTSGGPASSIVWILITAVAIGIGVTVGAAVALSVWRSRDPRAPSSKSARLDPQPGRA
ncbi:MAG: NHL repeat-containing protein [Thermoplasmata archaeon]|nr:NHL repeat-containing protein [Thermoplasmata archaeon]